jgi:Holliday junction resolvasome RuvABC endonuclease subunit
VTASLPGLEALRPPRSLELVHPVWGFDPSTKRISLGIIEPVRWPGHPVEIGVRWATLSLPQPRDTTRRLAASMDELLPWLREHVQHDQPEAVYVEQPFAQAKRVHPQSYFMVGVLLACLGAVLPGSCPLHTLNPPQWKAAALGQGHGHAREHEYLEWARDAAGYTGDLFDEAAAIGVATGGAVLRSK